MKYFLLTALLPFTLLAAAPAGAATPLPGCNGAPLNDKNGFLAGAFAVPKFQRMTTYCFDHNGMFTAALEDGTIWQQWPDDVRYAYWRKPPQHYVVMMRGSDENGILIVENDGLDYRVRRVR